MKIVGESPENLRITCGKGHFVLEERDPAEFPERDDEERLDAALALPLDVPWLRATLAVLHQAMIRVRDEPSWERGVLIAIQDGEGDFVSMSRTQMAVIHRRAHGLKNLKLMIPAQTVAALVTLPMSNRRTENATIRVGMSAALFSVGPIQIYSKLLEENYYPNWKTRVPSGVANLPIILDRKALLGVIRRMTVAASSAGTWEGMSYDAGPFEFRPVSLGPVQCTLSVSEITFECRVRNEIQSVETMSGSYRGNPIKSIYSVWQLKRVLGTMRTDSVSLQMTSEMGPCVISSDEAPDFRCVLSPIWAG